MGKGIDGKGHKITFSGDGGFTTVYICQNSLNFLLKIGEICCLYIAPEQSWFLK